VAAFVHCKRGRFGVLTRSRGKEKWQTVGSGEEGRRQAQELAAEINRQLEEERAREESEFLDWPRPGAALPIDRALRDWLFHYGPTVGRSTARVPVLALESIQLLSERRRLFPPEPRQLPATLCTALFLLAVPFANAIGTGFGDEVFSDLPRERGRKLPARSTAR
jgi:hypothetical protein